MIGALAAAVVALGVVVIVLVADGDDSKPGPCRTTLQGGKARIDLGDSGASCEDAKAVVSEYDNIELERLAARGEDHYKPAAVGTSGYSCRTYPLSEYPTLATFAAETGTFRVLGLAKSAHPGMGSQTSTVDPSAQVQCGAGTELLPANVYRRVLAPAAKRVGLVVAVEGRDEPRSAVSFHTLRHTCASMLFEAGRNVKQVQEWLGHSDPSFTLRTYVHLMDAGVGDADFLDEAVVAQPATRV